jgi:hypothetical protein
MRVLIRFVTAMLIIFATPTLQVNAGHLNGGIARALDLHVTLAPTLTALSPSTVAAGSPAFTLTVNGAGFVTGSTVRWNGSDRPTTFLSSTQLNAAIPAADVIFGGPFAITVATPTPGEISDPLDLTLYVRSGLDTLPDGVLGQPNFLEHTANNPLLPDGANRLYESNGVVVDLNSGRLFVNDYHNHRVLSWANAMTFTNGQAADLVLGQPDFNATSPNNGIGVSAHSLRFPESLAVDAAGNLYVADWGNSRVLEFNAPLTSGMDAARVFGQPDFSSFDFNHGGVSASSLYGPTGVALDEAGNLYVTDQGNHRVLEYNAPLTSDTAADRVLQQQYWRRRHQPVSPNRPGAGWRWKPLCV